MKDFNIKLIESILFIAVLINLFSASMWIPDEKWFSRFSLGLICLGFYAILKKLDKCGKN